MESCWRLEMHFFLLLSLLLLNLNRFYSLNPEGITLLRFRERVENDPYGALSNWNGYDDKDPCSWFGVACVDGKVVNLNLQDLCLKGTLAPELGELSHIKYLILHNNSFSGIIPKEIGELKELEVLDVGNNNLSGPLPSELGGALSLQILLLSHNRFLNSMSPELRELSMRSKFLVDENMLSDAAREAIWNQRYIARNMEEVEDAGVRRLLQDVGGSGPPDGKISDKKKNHTPPPLRDVARSDQPNRKSEENNNLSPLGHTPSPAPPFLSPAASPSLSEITTSGSRHTFLWKISVALGASFLTVSIIGVLFCRKNKVVTVRPWATGLSGQLQKAFVTGVPSLKRQEIEAACEDFSNIIGSSPDSTVYKGTLSNGVEIAVTTSTAAVSVEDWSKNLETQFRKKIDTLSKVNHKNFVNLLGYCKEEEPFTRMMVFEYAPNGTLFEHLHIKEAEHLDWATRLRVAMGMAYCLDHMHQLNPPIAHKNLQSKTVYLSEDYAAKISDLTFWNEATTVKKGSDDTELSNMSPTELEHNVYSFGVLLLEMMSGKLPFSGNEGQLIDWASGYLRKVRPISNLMDPTLKSYHEEEASALLDVILPCINPDPKKRPSMREVTARLREITGMSQDAATPKLSPLWWAELEILSTTDAS